MNGDTTNNRPLVHEMILAVVSQSRIDFVSSVGTWRYIIICHKGRRCNLCHILIKFTTVRRQRRNIETFCRARNTPCNRLRAAFNYPGMYARYFALSLAVFRKINAVVFACRSWRTDAQQTIGLIAPSSIAVDSKKARIWTWSYRFVSKRTSFYYFFYELPGLTLELLCAILWFYENWSSSNKDAGWN